MKRRIWVKFRFKKVRSGEREVKGQKERSEDKGLIWVCRKDLKYQIGRGK